VPASDRLVTGAERLSRAVLLGALLAGVLLQLVAPGSLQAAGPALVVLAGVLGLPHGAVDHLAWGWAQGESRPRPAVVAGYAVAALAAVALALLVPVPALVVLLVLATAHFAEGEVGWARLRGAAPHWPAGVAAGVAVVALPLALRPAEVRPLLAGLDPALPGLLLAGPLRAGLLLGTALLVVAGAASARRDRSRLGELLLVVAVAALLPPLAAFAAWFAGWHAVRHTARLVQLDPRNRTDLLVGDVARPLRRFARSAALPTAVALVGTAALVAVTGVTGGLLLALLALTVPHTAVVARLDGSARLTPTRRPPAAIS
jgi:Brp/Blh family beta-carotene 15,15'-monooxygenase